MVLPRVTVSLSLFVIVSSCVPLSAVSPAQAPRHHPGSERGLTRWVSLGDAACDGRGVHDCTGLVHTREGASAVLWVRR